MLITSGPTPTADGSLRGVPLTPATVGDLAVRHALQLRCAAPSGADVQVRGTCLDSRRVGPGQLYAALPGGTTHGARFAQEVVAAGAAAVLTDPEGADLVHSLLAGALATVPPLLVTDDPRRRLGPVAADVLGHPSHEVSLVGVTGTNGKTTVSSLVEELLRAVGVPTGLIGTIRSRILDTELASAFTTPEAPDLQRLLREMADAGCRAVCAEVSSHALAQHRVDGTRFAVVVFTNLSRDHLDFHGTIEAYFAAKLRLFTDGFAGTAVVGVDDPRGVEVARAARAAGLRVLTVGTGAGTTGAAADVTVTVTAVRPSGHQRLELTGPFGDAGSARTLELQLGMPGGFNATNAALALTTAHLLLADRRPAAGLDGSAAPALLPDGATVTADDLAAALGRVGGVPGRMERVVLPDGKDRPLVVVDYAHTPDAVAGAVAALREATPGRLVVVLGAGGDRDRGKRAGMGAAASGADLVVVTDDNPRTEDPAAIRAAVLAGVRAPSAEVGDRAEAVAAALAACSGPADTVLLAGKGHETGQSAGGTTTPFDDRAVARHALARWVPADGDAP